MLVLPCFCCTIPVVDCCVLLLQGFRTLVMGWRPIPEDEFSEWLARFRAAEASIVNRDELVQAVCEDIERDVLLLGSTAIEDKLQDEVPETIQFLHEANIHVWVLTGDKQSTAISIGMSSRLITPGMGVRR